MPAHPGFISPSVDRIYEVLHQDILSLHYYPGELISENAIAARFHVSRSPVRSAFLKLAKENLLEIRPQKGTFVSLLDFEYVREIVYMRSLVEVDILCQAAQSTDQSMLDDLVDNLHHQEQLIGQTGQAALDAFYLLDSQFHFCCFRYVGRKRLWEILQASQAHYQRFRMLDIVSQQILADLYQQHLLIYQYLCDKQTDLLSATLKKHLYGGIERLEVQVMNQHPEYFVQNNVGKNKHSPKQERK